MPKPNVAFVCVHNSCRSQIAEALAKHYGADVLNAYSAGTSLKDSINADALRLVKAIYDIDMAKTQYPKLIDELADIDIAITMGCGVSCPNIASKYTVDWGLDDPSGKDDEEFIRVIEQIDNKIKRLIEDIRAEN